jgi:myosin-9
MLETVRIRRAGYNVRLTYEEFIQLYRILLPKGLLSSQKDVRDFMNHFMDLNKQHYQLGMTKIYMRENQKMRLDIKLHTKIIESIVCIQRWFRSILQRRKFLLQRQAVVTIQSSWRMCMAQKQVHFRRGCFHGAAITVQASWRMFIARRNYVKLRQTTILLQAHIRGKLARARYQQSLKQKHMRERQKLRSTQSLPVNERSVDVIFEPVKRIRTPTPHYSLDADIELCQDPEESPAHRLTRQKRDQMLDQTEQQIRNLLINKDDQYFRKSSVPSVDPFLSYQPPPTSYRKEDVLDIGSKTYDVEKAMRRNEEAGDALKRFDVTKMPIRRVDSGPARRFDSNNGVRPTPATDVEIVFVNSTVASSSALPRSGPYNQQYSLDTLPQRRDIVCRSLNDEYQNYQPPIVYHQPQHEILARTTATAIAPKGKLTTRRFVA